MANLKCGTPYRRWLASALAAHRQDPRAAPGNAARPFWWHASSPTGV